MGSPSGIAGFVLFRCHQAMAGRFMAARNFVSEIQGRGWSQTREVAGQSWN